VLALRVLGPPRVSVDEADVHIDRRKVMALLVYLAVTAQRHSRDELAELLFGRRDRGHARADLRQTLSILRTAIGAHRLGADRLGVWLPGGNDVWMDLSEFQRLLNESRAADTKDDLSTVCGCLTAAAQLFRGQFLSSFFVKDSPVFEDWQLMMQESLRHKAACALQRLAEIHERWRQYDQAAEFACRWLTLDPLEESVHRRLMRLYALAGRRAEALHQYEACRTLLEKELDAYPDRETERLRECITSKKILPDTGSLSGGRSHLHAKTPAGSAPFLFALMSTAGEEQSIRQDIRELFGREQGRFLENRKSLFCAVFPTVSAAIRAAVLGQVRAGTRGCEMRIALLAGDIEGRGPSPKLLAQAEMCLEILRAGAILLNETAARLAAAGENPQGMTLRCLGSHRLKDLGPAQLLYVLEHPDLSPPLHPIESLDNRPNNLRTQPTPFIGRERELTTVTAVLRSKEARLLTLTGAGGTGKTRLALQAAAGLYDRFEQGLFFVDLASLREPEYVVGAIAAALNLREAGSGRRSLLETLKDYLENKELLLLLDNFEHLLPAAPVVAELLGGSSRLKVLATSREPLRLQAERIFQVFPMELASRGQNLEAVKRCEAVRLFCDRAAAVRATFELNESNVEAVVEICSRLDGLPLAIELAATRVGVLTPQTLLTKLKNRLDLLSEGPVDLPKRQQALRSEIDWSCDLLGPEERRIFRRLAVFPAGCTLDAAEQVCPLAGEDPDVVSNLCSLAEKSLVRPVEGNGELRYCMLETIREYASERLTASGDLQAVEPRFVRYYLELTEHAAPRLYGPEQMQWFERIENEYGNIQAALAWLHERRRLEEGLRMAGALGWFWFRRARFSEGQRWLELFYTASENTGPPGPRAQAAYCIGWLKLCLGSVFWGNPEGKRFFSESLRLWREAGNQRGIALSQVWLAWKDQVEGEGDCAIADQSVALARETGDPWVLAWCLKVAFSHLRRPDQDLASRRYALEEAIALARTTGDPFLLSQTLLGMGNVFGWVGELEAAEPWYRDSLRIAREIGDNWSILDSINCLADIHMGLGRIGRAKELFTEGVQLAQDFGARSYLAWFIGGFYQVARYEGKAKRALRLGAFSESILNPGSTCDPRFAEELGLDIEEAALQWRIGENMSPGQAVAFALVDE